MNWLVNTLGSSIGKKLLMAITGLGFILFLIGHLVGNLTIYGGGDLFNAYAEHLHSLGPLVKGAETGLVVFALVHVSLGLLLFYQNWKARPVRYAVDKRAGGRTVGSGTMPYTGILILVFVLLHLSNFTLADKTHRTIFEIVSATFQNPMIVVFYVAMMIVVGVHVSHGFWSAFQTLGANHPKYMPGIQIAGIGISVVFGLGFGFIPIFVSLLA
jgi:succinate dehydrogenase / fumarate reductase, cytochrome b subunit